VMGKHSSLGSIDPQFSGIPAHGILEEFNRAWSEIAVNPLKAHIWQPILAKYPPAFVGECQKAVTWSETLARDWLKTGMFSSLTNPDPTIDPIIRELSDHALSLSHSRHISATKATSIGLKIVELEQDDKLQDLVLSIHHATIHTLSSTLAFKIIENHKGTAFIQTFQQLTLKGP
jgi:hypothetical protein